MRNLKINKTFLIMEATELMQIIQNYAESHQPKSKNVFLLDEVKKVLELHKKRYAQINADEKPLLAVNKNIMAVGGYGWSGLLITDKKLYYKCTKDTFWAGLVMLSNKGEIPLKQIHSIAIGRHDACFGTAYVGHQLLINGKNMGLLRMGGSVEFDEKAINELSIIFNKL